MGYPLPGKLTNFIACLTVLSIAVWTPSLCFSQSSSVSEEGEDIKSSQLQAPLVAFTQNSYTINERSGRVVLTVKLLEANEQAVSVDVVFLDRSSTALIDDFNDYQTETVSFGSADTSGTTQEVTIYLQNDQEYEGHETAIFQLQNNTSGTIVSPRSVTLTIRDNDAPDISINELFADAKVQRNNASSNSSSRVSESDFIEFVNNETIPIDIGGWVLSSERGLSYRFPEETVVEPGKALVLFSNEYSGYFGGAQTLFASGMDLSNEGDTIRLVDRSENMVLELGYGPEASQGQSLVLNTDDPARPLKRHMELPGSERRRFSPGRKSDGTSYGSRYADRISGTEGWQIISSPAQSTFKELLEGVWTQGGTGSDAPTDQPTIYSWNEGEGGSFVPITDLNEELEAGKSYLVYFFEDDNPRFGGIQGGFPKNIETNQPDNSNSLNIPVYATDENENSVIDNKEGWNLLGNPFGTELSVASILNALQSVEGEVNANILIWNPEAGSGNGAFIPLSEGDTIAPFQGFWVRYMNPTGVEGSVTFSKNELAEKMGDTYYREPVNNQHELTLGLKDDKYEDTYSLVFRENGSLELNQKDAFKLSSLNPDAINIFGTIGSNRLSKNILPLELEANLELPIAFEAPGRNALELNWEGLNSLPENWTIKLIDKELDKEVDLKSATNYRFSLTEGGLSEDSKSSNDKLRLSTNSNTNTEARFLLSISAKSIAGSEVTEIPESVKLNPNYPNPFNPTTTISYELKEESEVLLTIWNIVGQKVVTLVDEMKEAGEHTATWNASDMPSGLYIAQLEVGGEVFIRKMTLIK